MKDTKEPQIELAIQFLMSNEVDAAEIICREVLLKNPFNAHAYDLLAVISSRTRRWDEALLTANKAISLDKNNGEFYTHRAIIYKNLKFFKNAISDYNQASLLLPRSSEPLYNLAILLMEMGDLDKALELSKKAARLDPNNIHITNNLGSIFQKLGLFEQASSSYKKSLKINTNQPHIYNNLCGALAESDRISESLKVCSDAIKQWPNYPEIYNAKANALMRLNKIDEAIETSEIAIKLQPNHSQAHYTKGMCLLLRNKFIEGWNEYTWRTKRESFWPKRSYNKPEWSGSPLKNKTLLIHWEQGYGDIIQFVRYLKILKTVIEKDEKHHNARIIFDCPKNLLRLVKNNIIVDDIGDWGDNPPSFDFYIPLMDLAKHFTKTEDEISKTTYITKHIETSIKVPKVNESALKVGLTWSSEHKDTYRRKVCSLSKLSKLFKNLNYTFYGIQFGNEHNQLESYTHLSNVFDLGDKLGDFAHTAAIINQLDLIISIDTYIVHLAGAMGIRTWVLLPFSPDWRWQLNRSDSPWYPSIKLFRQPKPGDWDSVVMDIKNTLETNL